MTLEVSIVIDRLSDNQGDSSLLNKLTPPTRTHRSQRSSPDQMLPPEIIAMIFFHCADTSGMLRLRWPEQNSVLWALGHVCSRWRQIALAAPHLWCRIDARSYSPLPQSTLEYLREILTNRGGRCAVELQIMPACDNDWRILRDLYSTYPSRLRSLWLTVNAWNSPTCLQYPTHAFDSVETLVLNFCRPFYMSVETESTSVIKGFSTSSHLRKLEIYRECAYNPNLLDLTSFPWAQLSSLTISSITTSDISRILRECIDIAELVIGLQVDSSDYYHPLPEKIALEHLQSMTIQFGANCDIVLDRLATPALKNLYFGRWAICSRRCILDLIERSGSDIEIFHYPMGETSDIISLLDVMPHLRELSVPTAHPVSEQTLDAMRVQNVSPRLYRVAIPTSSIRSALRFLQSGWSAQSSCWEYSGICDAKIKMRWDEFKPDREWFEALIPELAKKGCTVDFTVNKNIADIRLTKSHSTTSFCL